MDEQNGASIEENERTLLTDAKPQTEYFEEATRNEKKAISTRNYNDDKMFTKGSGTSVDKNTTYTLVTDVEPHENAHGTTSTMDVYDWGPNTKSKYSKCKEVMTLIYDRELAKPTVANDSVVQPRNNELLKRSENRRTLNDKNTANSTDKKPPDTADRSDTSGGYFKVFFHALLYFTTGWTSRSQFGTVRSDFKKICDNMSRDMTSQTKKSCIRMAQITMNTAEEFQTKTHEEDKNSHQESRQCSRLTGGTSSSQFGTVGSDLKKINDIYDTRVTNDEYKIYNVQTDKKLIPKEIGKYFKVSQPHNIENNSIVLYCSKKITKLSIVEGDYKETMARVREIVTKMINRQSDDLEELEFRLCDLKKEHLKEFLLDEVLKAVVCKISKLSIGYTKNVTDLIPSYCRIASDYKSTKLSLVFNDLKNEDIEALLENLDESEEYEEIDMSYNRNIGPAGYENIGKIVEKHKVKTLRLADCNISDDHLHSVFDGMGDAKNDKYTELDLSYNRDIGSDGYENIGENVQKHEVRTLRLADCDISDDDLHKLFDGMGEAKLEELDISCTDNLTTDGFEYIGKQVANKRIKRLKLSDTQLNVETLTAFYNEVVGLINDSDGQQVLVEEIDVSYNSTMEPEAYKVLGSMVKLFGVKKLSLAGCGLRKENLQDFREKINSENSMKQTGQYTKMKSLNAGDNTSIGKGIVEIARIVKECLLEELDISECRFSPNELADFIDALKEAKLRCLYLGEKRQFEKNYISQVCNILPSITETLHLKGTMRNDLHSMLQEKLIELEESDLVIKLDDDVTLRSRI